jgi:hypothetical protein
LNGERPLAALLLKCPSDMMVLFLLAALVALSFGAWRLSRNRRNPGFWEGSLLWVMSFLLVVVLLART